MTEQPKEQENDILPPHRYAKVESSQNEQDTKEDYYFLRPKKIHELDDTPPVQVWDGVICLGDRVMISGATKSYKSFFAKQFTFCITYGLPFLERPVSTAIPMLDVDMELREYFCRLRVERIAAALGISDTREIYCRLPSWPGSQTQSSAIRHLGDK